MKRSMLQRTLLLGVACVLLSLFTHLPLSAEDYIPGQANRIGNLWQLNTDKKACTDAAMMSDNLFVPPQASNRILPIPVGINIHVNKIPSISDSRNQFHIDGLLTSTWCDARISKELPENWDELVLYNNAAEGSRRRVCSAATNNSRVKTINRTL